MGRNILVEGDVDERMILKRVFETCDVGMFSVLNKLTMAVGHRLHNKRICVQVNT
jgi:hypothetical protein